MNQTEPAAVELETMYVVGISADTNNADEMAGRGKIPALWQRFYEEGIGDRIPNRVAPQGVAVLYTDIESDENGPYRIIIGALVKDPVDVPEGMLGSAAGPGWLRSNLPVARWEGQA